MTTNRLDLVRIQLRKLRKIVKALEALQKDLKKEETQYIQKRKALVGNPDEGITLKTGRATGL